MDNLQTARNFFEQCDYGKGWDACKIYCRQDATFETEAETLSAINTLDTYCDWMTDAIDMFDDNVEIEIKAEAYDRPRDIVLIYAEIRGNLILGPEPMFAKTDYVYVLKFDYGKISHMAKIWDFKLPQIFVRTVNF